MELCECLLLLVAKSSTILVKFLNGSVRYVQAVMIERNSGHFDALQVTAILKCANHKLFCKDLEHQLADLQHTLG